MPEYRLKRTLFGRWILQVLDQVYDGESGIWYFWRNARTKDIVRLAGRFPGMFSV